jgi:hypothetical protein
MAVTFASTAAVSVFGAPPGTATAATISWLSDAVRSIVSCSTGSRSRAALSVVARSSSPWIRTTASATATRTGSRRTTLILVRTLQCAGHHGESAGLRGVDPPDPMDPRSSMVEPLDSQPERG